MIRPIFTEVALFVAPFVAYALFLWATRAGVLDVSRVVAAAPRCGSPSRRWCW